MLPLSFMCTRRCTVWHWVSIRLQSSVFHAMHCRDMLFRTVVHRGIATEKDTEESILKADTDRNAHVFVRVRGALARGATLLKHRTPDVFVL